MVAERQAYGFFPTDVEPADQAAADSARVDNLDTFRRQKVINAAKQSRAALIAANPSYAYQIIHDEKGALRDAEGNLMRPNGHGYDIVGVSVATSRRRPSGDPSQEKISLIPSTPVSVPVYSAAKLLAEARDYSSRQAEMEWNQHVARLRSERAAFEDSKTWGAFRPLGVQLPRPFEIPAEPPRFQGGNMMTWGRPTPRIMSPTDRGAK